MEICSARCTRSSTSTATFRRSPSGWWGGIACRLRGGDRIRQILERELGISMGENTDGDRLGLHLAQCNGTCEHAAQVWVNGKVVGPLTSSATVRLVRELK